MPWIGQKAGGWIPALLQRKSWNKKASRKNKPKNPKSEAGCRAERGIWALGHESSSQAHFVLFPLLGMEKALHGSGKRALNLPGAITHRPAEVPLQRGSRGSSLLQTASQHQEKTTLHKKPLAAPKQPLSLC